MNNSSPPPPSPRDDIDARAAAWLAERDGGFTPQSAAAFEAWCAADPRHAAAVERLDRTWRALVQLRSYRPQARLHPDHDLLAPHPRAKGRRWLPVFAIAAAVFVLAAVVLVPRKSSPLVPRDPAADARTFSTTDGGFQRLTLSDGSLVELNDRTELHVRFTRAERRLTLVRGEAHFSVASNKDRPFVVQSRGVAVRAVGTAFGIRLGDERVEVLVTEGTVQLDRAIESNRSSSTVRAGEAAPTLTAGWRALVPAEPALPLELEQLGPEEIRQALAWQAPRLVFVETPLAQVIEQFNRRNRLQLALGDAELATMPVGGSFRAENVEAFVRLLASNGDITAERPAPDLIVLRRPR